MHVYIVIIYSLDDALGKTIMRRMRVCCSAYIMLYSRFYRLPVRFTHKNEMYNDGDDNNNNKKKAKKSPEHESAGSRLQHPHRRRRAV